MGHRCRERFKIQNIELPGDMKRAMAKQAEAERERRANIINADGEKAAAETLAQAAEILAKNSRRYQSANIEHLRANLHRAKSKDDDVIPLSNSSTQFRGGKK